MNTKNNIEKKVSGYPDYISKFIQVGLNLCGDNIINVENLVTTESYSSYVVEAKKHLVAIMGFNSLHDDYERDAALQSLLKFRKQEKYKKSKTTVPLVVLEGENAHFIPGTKGTEKGLVQRQMIDLVRIMLPNDLGETLRQALSPASKNRFWPLFMPQNITKGLDRRALSREVTSIYGYEKSQKDVENVWKLIKKYFTEEIVP